MQTRQIRMKYSNEWNQKPFGSKCSKVKIRKTYTCASLNITRWRHMYWWRYRSTYSQTCNVQRWVTSFTRQPLYSLGNRIWKALFRRQCRGPQRRTGRSGEEKYPFPCLESNPGGPSRDQSIYWMIHPGLYISNPVASLICRRDYDVNIQNEV